MKQHATKLGALIYRHFVPFYAVEHVAWFTLWLIPASVVLIIYLLFDFEQQKIHMGWIAWIGRKTAQ